MIEKKIFLIVNFDVLISIGVLNKTMGRIKMIEERISLAMIVEALDLNGISNVVLNFCKYIDKEIFKITIFAGMPIDKFQRAICAEYEIDIVELPTRTPNRLKFYYELFKKLDKDRYDMIHVHGNSSIISIDLMIAKLKGIKKRIAHCHNSKSRSKLMHKLLLPLFNKLYTDGIACSSLAGEWLFGKNEYTIIPNGLEVNKFAYSEYWREKIRNDYNIKEDGIVLGHVGTFNNQKNQEYLLNIFKELHKEKENVYLIFVGNGRNFDRVNELVNIHPNKEKIIFYGETTTPESVYSAMDIFVFPSRFEGFGMVMTEAQTSGLPCIASTAVPKDVAINDVVGFLPISPNDIHLWVKMILEIVDNKMIDRRNFTISKTDITDIAKCVETLENIYLNERHQYGRN